jgi:hypothetical protein
MNSLLAHGRAVMVLTLVAAVLMVAGQGLKARVSTDAQGNVHIATANTTTQRVFINGVDILGELSVLSAVVEAKATGPTTTTTTTTPTTTATTTTTSTTPAIP